MKGMAIFISAPSGTGKSTVTEQLLKSLPKTYLAVSVTTRTKRPAETSGKDYDFVSKDDFESMIKNDELAEFTSVFDNYYGTPKHYLNKIEDGENIIFDITVDGVKAFYKKFENKVRDFVSILLLPPSLEELKRRLENRNTESKEKQNERLSSALDVLSSWSNFDYCITCNKVDQAVRELSVIIDNESKKLHRLNSPPFIDLIESFK